MATGTTAMLWRKRFVERAKLREGLDGVVVSYDNPGSDMDEGGSLWFQDSGRGFTQTVAMGRPGRRIREDTYTVRLNIQVILRQGESQIVADDLANELFGEVEDFLATDMQFGEEFEWHSITAWNHAAGVMADGAVGSQFTVDIEVKARRR